MEKLLMHPTISRYLNAPHKLTEAERQSPGLRHLAVTRRTLREHAQAVRNAREDVEAVGYTTSTARPDTRPTRDEYVWSRVSEAIDLGLPADLEAACFIYANYRRMHAELGCDRDCKWADPKAVGHDACCLTRLGPSDLDPGDGHCLKRQA